MIDINKFLSEFSMDDLNYCVNRHIISKNDYRFLLAMRNIHKPSYLSIETLSKLESKLQNYKGISKRVEDARTKVNKINSLMRLARSAMFSSYRSTNQLQLN